MPKKIVFQLATVGGFDINRQVYTLEVLEKVAKDFTGMVISKKQEQIGKILKAYIKDKAFHVEAEILDMQKLKEFLKTKGV